MGFTALLLHHASVYVPLLSWVNLLTSVSGIRLRRGEISNVPIAHLLSIGKVASLPNSKAVRVASKDIPWVRGVTNCASQSIQVHATT